MNDFYLILGSEAALADRALTKLQAELKSENAELTSIYAADSIVGDISDALAPSLFSERRALIIRDLQDLPEDNKEEILKTKNLIIDLRDNGGGSDNNFKIFGLYNYVIPPDGTHEDHVLFIQNIPTIDVPAIFGLHDNADITCAINETNNE